MLIGVLNNEQTYRLSTSSSIMVTFSLVHAHLVYCCRASIGVIFEHNIFRKVVQWQVLGAVKSLTIVLLQILQRKSVENWQSYLSSFGYQFFFLTRCISTNTTMQVHQTELTCSSSSSSCGCFPFSFLLQETFRRWNVKIHQWWRRSNGSFRRYKQTKNNTASDKIN